MPRSPLITVAREMVPIMREENRIWKAERREIREAALFEALLIAANADPVGRFLKTGGKITKLPDAPTPEHQTAGQVERQQRFSEERAVG